MNAFLFPLVGRSNRVVVPERIDMIPTIEALEDGTREDQILPRDQFVPQVRDLALPAGQVLEEQTESLRYEDAAPIFVP